MPEAPATITVSGNGPYLVSGASLTVKRPAETAEGEPIAWVTGPAIETEARYALCRCGSSSQKPFCDGTHAVIPDGPLVVTGGVTVMRADGEAIEMRPRMALCRCGGSHNKPLCDGTHKDIGFHHQP